MNTEILNIVRVPIKQARNSWSGETGKQRARNCRKVIFSTARHYSEKLNINPFEIIKAIEKYRSYSSINYYQEGNFPTLDENITIYESLEDLKNKIDFSKGFRCPACGGISKNPYRCDSGQLINDEKICDWKAYGLLGTMGKGFAFTIKDGFLKNPKIDDIFYPISLETEL